LKDFYNLSDYFMRKLWILWLVLCMSFHLWAQENTSQNIAYQDGTVRFTLVNEGVVRMEWQPTGRFVDSPSLLAVDRKYDKVDFQLTESGDWIEISTSKMELKYRKGSGRFSSDNLIISSKGLEPSFRWRPGDVNTGNLKGTFRTLDGYDGEIFVGNGHDHGDHLPMPIEDGLLSTDGWTLIDDSEGLLFDNSEWAWVTERNSEEPCQDWYFMAYGHDYKEALQSFTAFAGKVPLPPRYAFGYWWSRYWNYSDDEFRDLVTKFETYNIPLDVLVVDMDWHYVAPGKGGWTGYTWNRSLFPEPASFLQYLKNKGLQVTLNLHPAGGIEPYEERYKEMAEWMGMNPQDKDCIAYSGSDKRFMSGWLNTILHPMEKDGVDFWWLDWQQDVFDSRLKKLNNTWWLNYVLFSDMERNRTTRPLLYHRWGGLGNHRYQIGFSGDSYSTWKSLEFLPYFNSTASNVLYGYWSHDLGGHQFAKGVSQLDKELFVRWMQFGAFSPIMRTHSMKNAAMNKEPWAFDQTYLEVLRNTIQQRYHIAPYVYTMARKTYDEAISICRPMYYDYPETDEAYQFKNQYMFGDEMLVAPITSPMKEGFASVKVWLPEGNDWYEWSTGTLLKGGQVVERAFSLDEYPVYVKAGSILPFYGDVKNLSQNDEPLRFTVFPGDSGTFSFYEDNGNDQMYREQYARTQLSSHRKGNILTISIGKRSGNYKGMPKKRTYHIDVLGSAPASKVTVNGKVVDYTYSGTELKLSVMLPECACEDSYTVQVIYDDNLPDVNDGLYGKFKRMKKSFLAMRYRNANIDYIEELGNMESTGRTITYHPDLFIDLIRQYQLHYAELPALLEKQRLNEKDIQWFLQSVYWKHE
jgi:alpha-glucosidase (family GH31 glycosyl hydrolase)